jgi:RNA polymerase Rpb1
MFGCLSSQGPVGLALGFYNWVQHLDVAHSDSRFEPTKHGWGTPPPHLPCFIRVFGDVIRRLYAGVSSKNVTLGVPQLKEIINVVTNIKTPSLTVFLRPNSSVSAELAKIMQQELTYTSLCTVTAAVEIWYDPDPQSTIIKEDQVFVEAFFTIPDEEMEQQLHTYSLRGFFIWRWTVLKMIDCKLTMEFISLSFAVVSASKCSSKCVAPPLPPSPQLLTGSKSTRPLGRT